MKTVEGVVEKILYYNEDNGYAVIEIKGTSDTPPKTVITGSTIKLVGGELLESEGEWVTNKTYGSQFKATSIKVKPPVHIEGITKYLGSGLIKGIGPELAARIVEKFGTTTFDVLDTSIKSLLKVQGIGKKKVESIQESWKSQKAVRDIMVFLTENGISTSRAAKIYQLYGDNSILIVKENPYRLASDIVGIGFKSADIIAKNQGISPESTYRIQSGIEFILKEINSSGHCASPYNMLVMKSIELLQVDGELVKKNIQELLTTSTLIESNGLIYTPRLYQSEVRAAMQLKELTQGTPLLQNINVEKAIIEVEKEAEISLSEKQKEAIRLVSKSKVTVITGGPGVGKTTLVNSILKILNKNEYDTVLCAPTGRAAKRMFETSGQEAKTIHRLLEFDPKLKMFKKNAGNPILCDFIILDESSMVDVQLFDSLLQAIPFEANLIIVGDVDQLPSVGPGQVLRDIIESGIVSVVKLTEIFRQAKESKIITNAYRINNGLMPISSSLEDKINDFFFINQDNPEKIHDTVMTLVTERIPSKFGYDPMKDIQVLVPMNKSGLGTRTFNIELQKLLNSESKYGVERYGNKYAVNDKVMQIKNNYDKDVFNGDIGYIQSIDKEEETLLVSFDGRQVDYKFVDLDQLQLAYATSIHKSQGSEYKAVVLVVHTQHYPLLQKNLIYTGVTRGKNLVIVVGSTKAFQIALSHSASVERYTQLKMWLQK